MPTLLSVAYSELQKVNSLWIPQEWEGREMDSWQETYQAMEIRLSIPNGGIIGVSVWDLDRKTGWFLPTELLDDHNPDWYNSVTIHIAFGKQAIEVLRQTLQPWNPGSHAKRRRAKDKGEYRQLTIADALAELMANPSPETATAAPLVIGGNRPIPETKTIPAVKAKAKKAKPRC